MIAVRQALIELITRTFDYYLARSVAVRLRKVNEMYPFEIAMNYHSTMQQCRKSVQSRRVCGKVGSAPGNLNCYSRGTQSCPRNRLSYHWPSRVRLSLSPRDCDSGRRCHKRVLRSDGEAVTRA